MAIIKKSQAVDLDRPTGAQLAVFADITDPYPSLNNISGDVRDQMIVTWQLQATYVDGNGKQQRFMHSEFVSPSLHKKAKFKKWLDGIAGRVISDADMPENFDTQKLIGLNVILNLLKGEDGFSKMQGISAAPQGMPRITVENYKRPAWIDDHIANQTRLATAHKAAADPTDPVMSTMFGNGGFVAPPLPSQTPVVTQPVTQVPQPQVVTQPAVAAPVTKVTAATIDDLLKNI
jgi:hypothetical protein